MTRLQFRILYREFLFRVVDLELIAPQGDMSRLLGQFAALLLFVSAGMALGALAFGDNQTPRATLLIRAWGAEHSLIATTMLVVGIFAVLSWDSVLPDRRDVLVLGPLPVHARTLFLAKVAASATALSVTVVALNALTGIAWPLALAPPSMNLVDLILMPAVYRWFAAYWVTMAAAGAFVFGSLLSLQGAAALLLPRRRFLRLSAFLQMAAFCLLLLVYFLQPALAAPEALAAPANQRLLAWLPSYWFLGLFQELGGAMHPGMAPLVRRAWTGLGIAIFATFTVYLLSYFRSLRRIVEEPDIVPRSHGQRWQPLFGNSLETAIGQFCVRTLLRSRQHRVMLAFYLGIGFAIVILLLRGGVGKGRHFLEVRDARLLFSSFVIMTVWVVGTRVVFSMPHALGANWIFRMTEIRSISAYLIAIRRTLFVLAVGPVWLAAAAVFLSIWPWRPAAGHLLTLALWGILVAYLSLHAFQKIPFTCSYLPGKSYFHMAFLAAIGLLFLIGKGVEFERRALADPVSYAKLIAILGVAAAVSRWRTVASAQSADAIVQFEEVPDPAVTGIGLYRDGVLPD